MIRLSVIGLLGMDIGLRWGARAVGSRPGPVRRLLPRGPQARGRRGLGPARLVRQSLLVFAGLRLCLDRTLHGLPVMSASAAAKGGDGGTVPALAGGRGRIRGRPSRSHGFSPGIRLGTVSVLW